VPQGTVKWFSTQKGYGFIAQEGGQDIFVHITGLAAGTTSLAENQAVEFEVREGQKGPQAVEVKPAEAKAAEVKPVEAEAEEAEPEAAEAEEAEAEETEAEEAEPEEAEAEEAEAEPDEA
jgi:CspA family cold shock protein